MAPTLVIQPVRVATPPPSADGDGRLVLADGLLVAVLVRLDDPDHGPLVGSWFLETGYGLCITAVHPVFDDLDAAQAWVGRRLAAA